MRYETHPAPFQYVLIVSNWTRVNYEIISFIDLYEHQWELGSVGDFDPVRRPCLVTWRSPGVSSPQQLCLPRYGPMFPKQG